MTSVVVTGATGNVGWAVVRALARSDEVDRIVGLARRTPEVEVPKVRWVRADVRHDDLASHFRGADAVIHLAWALQPSHDLAQREAVNVAGSRRVFDAVVRAGVACLVYASSIGAYSPGPKDRRVDESWPTDGVAGSTYSLQKSRVERILDDVETANPDLRVVRMRKALVFQRAAASRIARVFLGRLAIVSGQLSADRIPVVPRLRNLPFQTVHGDDAGEAYRLVALHTDARGAYNVAAEPVLDAERLAEVLGARTIPSPSPELVRLLVSGLWQSRLLAAEPGWVDLAVNAPPMATTRLEGLGWRPRTSAGDALRELLDGFGSRAGAPTPPLQPR